jgi:alpha-glucosidase
MYSRLRAPLLAVYAILLVANKPAERLRAEDPSVPAIRAIDPVEKEFFSKQLDFEGIPIKAHQVVTDDAVLAGHARLKSMFAELGPYRETILQKLRNSGVELHIIGRDQVTTDLPEWRQDKGKPLPEYHGQTRDERTRGMGGRLVSCGEENLLRLAKDRYRGRDICVHEFAHVIRNIGMNAQLRARFDAQFQKSLEQGHWVGAYAGSNANEYFAELSMWYFGTHGDLGMKGPKPQNGPEGLKAYDPEAYTLFEEFYRGRAGM